MKLNELKSYLKIEGNYDDELLKTLLTAAEKFVCSAISEVVKEDRKKDKRFQLAVAMIVADWYENRSVQTGAMPYEMNYGVLSLIQQLRYCDKEETK